MGRRPAAVGGGLVRRRDVQDPYADDLLDFPERDGILAALEAARGADEHAIPGELRKFRGQGLARLEREAREAAREFAPVDDAGASLPPRVVARSHAAFFLGDARATTADECPRAWPASTRDAERRRLLELHERAAPVPRHGDAGAGAAARAGARDPDLLCVRRARAPGLHLRDAAGLPASALREPRRAARARRARRREADRRAAAARAPAVGVRPPGGAPADAARRRAAHRRPRPPQHPPEDDLPERRPRAARARRQRAAVDGDGDDDAADRRPARLRLGRRPVRAPGGVRVLVGQTLPPGLSGPFVRERELPRAHAIESALSMCATYKSVGCWGTVTCERRLVCIFYTRLSIG